MRSRSTIVCLAVLVCLFTATTLQPAAAFVHTGDATREVIHGGRAADNVTGGDEGAGQAGDFIFGKGNPARRRDRLNGEGGQDTILGGKGKDLFFGGADGDSVVDDDGRPGDKLFGEAGPDLLVSVDGAKDRLDCGGEGGDIALADTNDVVVDCQNVQRVDGTFLVGPDPFEALIGANGADVISASGSFDYHIAGKGGADLLVGNSGNDTIYGGRGADVFRGHGEADFLVDDDGTAGDVLGGDVGNDFLYSADGARDVLVCGDGTDHAYGDIQDVFIDCDVTVFAENSVTGYL